MLAIFAMNNLKELSLRFSRTKRLSVTKVYSLILVADSASLASTF